MMINQFMKALSLSLLVFISGTLFANPSIAGNRYVLFSIGYGLASTHYPDSVQTTLSAAEQCSGAHSSRNITDVAVYFPFSMRHSVVGISANRTLDSVSGRWQTDVDSRLYALSLVHFFSDTIGTGAFVRGDIGKSNAKLSTANDNYQSGKLGDGRGYTFGVGFGIARSRYTNVLLSFNSTTYRLQADKFYATTMLLHFFF